MDWKLIIKLSLFGLAMAIASVWIVPANVEPLFWLMTFLVTGFLIGRAHPGRHFLHGLMVGIANSVWVTAAHSVFVMDVR